MARDYTITAARNAGEKPNTHPKAKPGSVLVKWYLKLADSEAGEDEVYCQKQPGNDLSEGMQISGRLEKGEFGWRLFPEQTQGSGGGNFQRPNLKPPVPDPQAERSRRIERQHSQEMSLRLLTATGALKVRENTTEDDIRRAVRDWTDFFAQDLDAEVGGGIGRGTDVVVKPHPTADVSAESNATMGETVRVPTDSGVTGASPEASSPQKRKLTQLFNKAGIAREAQKAIVLYRCRSEKATKDGASQLIQDLTEGATHDSLIAEVHDAARSGDPLAIRAEKLIPTDMPNDESWVDDGSLPPAESEAVDAPF